jgi:hypothetical protein
MEDDEDDTKLFVAIDIYGKIQILAIKLTEVETDKDD